MATILLVEDDEASLYAISRLLSVAGYEVRAARRTAAALALFDHAVDLLLTDLGLTDGAPRGFSLAEDARTRKPGLPVVYMTGFDGLEPHHRERALGPILMKPTDPDVLLAAVATALARARDL